MYKKLFSLVAICALLLTQVPESAFAQDVNVSGRLVYARNNLIFSSQLNGADVKQLTFASGDIDYKPKFSPDGTRIAFVKLIGQEANDREIYVMNADGSNQTRLTRSLGRDEAPNWTRDNRIVFESARDGNTEIYVMNADGSNQMQLTFTANTVSNSNPSISPDNTKVLFSSNINGSSNGYGLILSNPGASWVQYTHDSAPVVNGAPIMTGDGTKLVFAAINKPGYTGNQRLYVLDLITNSTRMLTEYGTNYYDQFPSFNASYSEVYFTSKRAGNVDQIFKINLSGGSAQQISGLDGTTGSAYPSVQHLNLKPALKPSAPQSMTIRVDQQTVQYDVRANVSDAYGQLDLSTLEIVRQPISGTAVANKQDGTVTFSRLVAPQPTLSRHIIDALFPSAYAATTGDSLNYRVCSTVSSQLCAEFTLAIVVESGSTSELQAPGTGLDRFTSPIVLVIASVGTLLGVLLIRRSRTNRQS